MVETLILTNKSLTLSGKRSQTKMVERSVSIRKTANVVNPLKRGTTGDLAEIQKSLVETLAREQKVYEEFLLDSKKSPKLTEWEKGFISDLNKGYLRGILIRFEDLSEKQLIVCKKIQTKIYSVG